VGRGLPRYAIITPDQHCRVRWAHRSISATNHLGGLWRPKAFGDSKQCFSAVHVVLVYAFGVVAFALLHCLFGLQAVQHEAVTVTATSYGY
jgi:hypothetical protein